MTNKEIAKMIELKIDLKLRGDEIRLKQLQHQPVALLRAAFYKAQQPYRKLWLKQYKEDTK